MILTSILLRVAWSATYTYILLLFVAAAFIAYVSRPKRHGEVVKRLFGGTLLKRDELDVKYRAVEEPSLHVRCLPGGKVLFQRLSIAKLTASGAVSVAVTYKGKDVDIIERDSPGYPNDEPRSAAEFIIDMTGFEWRHIRWTDEDSGLWCAFSLHVREGIDFIIPLKR